MRPSQTILVLDDLRTQFSGPLHRKRVELSLNDSQTVLEVYQQWLLLMIDLGYLHYGSLQRDATRLFTDMVKRDVLDLNNAFADLLGLVRSKNFKGFKALCSRVSDHLFSFLKGDMMLCSQGDVYAAKRLTQAFAYTSRLTLNDIDLTQQCLDDYMDVEDNIFDDFPETVASKLNQIIKRWMKSFDPTRFHFQHGPGSVAGLRTKVLEVKYKDLSFDNRTTYAFGDPVWSAEAVQLCLNRTSQTIFVPKSYKTFRTISMESPTLQYLQQGVWREIDRVVGSSRYLRNRIGFHDQERNQRLSKEGSINRNYATIDLSAASDSVSYSLVKKVFRGTKLLRYIVATRSPRTLLPDGRLIDLKKFAPMGSALCFPIETIIFAAICQYVTRKHGLTGDYSVFGDDIIVPTQCAEDAMALLELFGFSVNREKSFTDPECWFRESCGAEFCDGFDVTPMRVSRKYSHVQRGVRVTSLVSLANEAYRRDFRNLRQFFLRRLRQHNFRPLFGPNALLGDSYTNFHLKKRWNRDLQRYEARATMPVAKFPKVQDEEVRLRHWFESTHGRLSIGDGFVSNVGRVTVSLEDCWLPTSYDLVDHLIRMYGDR